MKRGKHCHETVAKQKWTFCRTLMNKLLLERVKGIEPSPQAWEARILPLNHTRFRCALYQ